MLFKLKDKVYSTDIEYTPPPLQLSQPWISFALEVNPKLTLINLFQGLTPWRVYLDLTSLDANDTLVVQTEIKVHAPNSIPIHTKDSEGYIWLLEDKLTINVRTPKPGEPPVVMINENPVTMCKVIMIEPISGPWHSRLMIAQIQGISRQLRYMHL